MGQYFRIINESKEQYLEPFSMPCSERFPNLISNALMTRCITWLVCSSNNSRFTGLKDKKYYSEKYLGLWSGDKIEIIGDYDEEDLSRDVNEYYRDITREVIAMLFENDDELIEQYITEPAFFMFLAEVALLDKSPKNLINRLNKTCGKEWRQQYYKSHASQSRSTIRLTPH